MVLINVVNSFSLLRSLIISKPLFDSSYIHFQNGIHAILMAATTHLYRAKCEMVIGVYFALIG